MGIVFHFPNPKGPVPPWVSSRPKKRKRGRPRKVRYDSTIVTSWARPRGRPPRYSRKVLLFFRDRVDELRKELSLKLGRKNVTISCVIFEDVVRYLVAEGCPTLRAHRIAKQHLPRLKTIYSRAIKL